MLATLGALLGIAAICFVQVPSVKGGLSCAMDGSNPCIWDVTGASDQKFNGKIDISNVFQNGPIDATPAGADFKLDACKGVACTNSPCGKKGKGTCVICQTVSGASYGIGDLSTASCDISQSDPANQKWSLKLSYVDGAQARQCDVTFTYSAGDTNPELTFDQEKPTLDYHLTATADFTVPNAPAPTQNAVDLSNVFGLLFIGLLIAAAVGYIVIGIIVQAGVRGKRGTEMIPNFEFWKDFPFLLKDGIVFTFTYACLTFKNRT